MLESAVLTALLVGLLSAATLPVGAAIGLVWTPSDRMMAVMLAFGGGALLAAITIDLVAPNVTHGFFAAHAVGAVVGGMLFKVLDALVNRKGGYLRKPSTAITFWRDRARLKLHETLQNLRRTQPMGSLSPAAEEKMLSVMQIRDIEEGACLHRAGDPATNLYFIADGEIELIDPHQGGDVVDRLERNDAFGLLSFATGMPRTMDAHATRATRLLMLPRDEYMDLLPDTPELRTLMEKRVGGAEVARYLVQRHGLSAEEASAWQEAAVASLSQTGRFEPVRCQARSPDELLPLMRAEQRQGFFVGLSDASLRLLASNLVHKTNPSGHTYFHRGQAGDRLYVLQRGTVQLFDPQDRTRTPTLVQAGETFGAFAFLTEGTHSVTAVGHDDTQVLELRRRDFDRLLEQDPDLRSHLSQYLRRNNVVDYITGRHRLAAGKAAQWIERAATGVESGKAYPPLSELTKNVAGHEGAAMAIFLGILLDGIPESFVVGANFAVGGLGISLVAALLLANLPEALSSAAGMKEQGMKRTRILAMWTSLMVVSGIGAAAGALFLQEAPEVFFVIIEGIAVGAMLTMVAETMLPEAFHKGGGVVGLSTLAGFLATAFFSSLG